MKNPEIALDTWAREERGRDPHELGAAWKAAGGGLVSVASGGSGVGGQWAPGAGLTTGVRAVALARVGRMVGGGVVESRSGG